MKCGKYHRASRGAPMEMISGCTIRFLRVADRLVASGGVQSKRVGEFLSRSEKARRYRLAFL